MLDVQMLRNDINAVAERLAGRGFKLDVEAFAALENERKGLQTRTQELQAKRNASSKQIGIAKSKGEDVSAIMADVANLGDELKTCETNLARMKPTMWKCVKSAPRAASILKSGITSMLAHR